MNCGIPTDRAPSRPCASRMVALRSLLWFRIGVVAVRDTYVAISKQMVSSIDRMTSAVTGSMVAVSSTTEHPARARRERLGQRGVVLPDRGPVHDHVGDAQRRVGDQPLTVRGEVPPPAQPAGGDGARIDHRTPPAPPPPPAPP